MYYMIGFIAILTGMFISAFIMFNACRKSAALCYLYNNPKVLLSLVKTSTKSTKDQMDFILKDEELRKMFLDADIQNELQTSQTLRKRKRSNKKSKAQKRVIDHTPTEAVPSTESKTVTGTRAESFINSIDNGIETTIGSANDTESVPCVNDTSAEQQPYPDLDNPVLQHMLKNPEIMLSILPESEEKKEIEKALENPLFKSMLADSDQIKLMLETAQNKKKEDEKEGSPVLTPPSFNHRGLPLRRSSSHSLAALNVM